MSQSEIEQQISTAKNYPRQIQQFAETCRQMATISESVAEDCIYSLPRGGKKIRGPSVRFAELVYNSWGNCRCGARVIAEEKDYVIAQGVFHDLERNAFITMETRRRIIDKNGRRYNEDMVLMASNAAAAIALRNAILRGVPKALWTSAYEAAEAKIAGDPKTLNTRRLNALKYFRKTYSVTEADVCKALCVDNIAAIGTDELVTLTGYKTALAHNDMSVGQIFYGESVEDDSETEAEPPEKQTAKQKARAKAQAAKLDDVMLAIQSSATPADLEETNPLIDKIRDKKDKQTALDHYEAKTLELQRKMDEKLAKE
jgi:hypothetical protein